MNVAKRLELSAKLATLVDNNEEITAGEKSVKGKVATQLDALKAKKKANKEEAEKVVASFKDVKLAVSACNSVLPESIVGADDATKKRVERGRTFLRTILGNSFSDYDFALQISRAGGSVTAMIVYSFVGDALTRKARNMLATVTEYIRLAGVKLDLVTEESLVTSMKSGSAGSTWTIDSKADTSLVEEVKNIQKDAMLAPFLQMGFSVEEAEELLAKKLTSSQE